MSHYFDLKGLDYRTWTRRDGEASELAELASTSDVVLLLISDGSIADFLRTNAQRLGDVPVVHFSGALSVDGAFGCHPLASFGEDLFGLAQYENIGFVTDDRPYTFDALFPSLVNPAIALHPSKRSRYHAMAVLSGNFTVMLWEKAYAEMEALGVPGGYVRAYLDTIHHNLASRSVGNLTGPLVRGDTGTIERNLEALGPDPFADIYRSFVRVAGIDLEQQ